MAQLIVNIPDDKVAAVRQAILELYRRPEDWSGTDAQWVRRAVHLLLNATVREGLRRITERAAPTDTTDYVVDA